jgi:hypothetical protein
MTRGQPTLAATIALMFATGVMLAVMAAAFIEFLALNGVKILW